MPGHFNSLGQIVLTCVIAAIADQIVSTADLFACPTQYVRRCSRTASLTESRS
jgi:hypothetical protein